MKTIKEKIKKLVGFCLLILFMIKSSKKIKQANIVFILPYYHTGGAEKVHLNIVKALSNQKCCVIFTHLSATKNFYEEFKKYAQIIEINNIKNKKSSTINKLLQKVIIKSINKSKSIHSVFGCNTTYFYDLIGKLNHKSIKIDLIHALSVNDDRALSFVDTAKYVDYRVCINQKAKTDLNAIYNSHNVKDIYKSRIRIIENGIDILEAKDNEKAFTENIKFGFVGRWSEEKRPEIFLEVAKSVKQIYPEVNFVMAGTGMKSNLERINNAGVTFLGEITNEIEMRSLYNSLTGIIISSVYEGFPMVFMESMLFNVVPLSTNVGGISQHIKHMENGVLLNATTNEKLIKEFINNIILLIENKDLTQKIANSAKTYALSNFDIKKFNNAYQNLFLERL